MRGRIILFAFAFISIHAFSQNMPVHSVSVRLGVPLGVTYKMYTGRKEALEFALGTTGTGWGRQYYINSFASNSKYENFKYVNHHVNGTLYLQGRYLKDFPIPTTGMQGALNWYCGAGVNLKVSRITYTYTDADAIPVTQNIQKTDIDFGPEAILGAEYWLEGTPFSFYGEGSLTLELFDRLSARAYGAIGVRFHFIQ